MPRHSPVRVTSLVYGTPLMIGADKLAQIETALRDRLLADCPDPMAPVDGPDVGGCSSVAADGISTIEIRGTLANRTTGMQAMSGLCSYAAISAQFSAAMSDPAVRGIVLDIDSCGGESDGVFELSDQIKAARGVKPVYAVADQACLSAAYAIACAAERIYVGAYTGGVGSIGVVACHVDRSKANVMAGIAPEYISAGTGKTDGNPNQPLTDPARERLQAEVDRRYALFVDAVAANRGLTDAAIRAIGAICKFGSDGVAAGLADRVGTMATARADMLSAIQSPRNGAAAASTRQPMGGQMTTTATTAPDAPAPVVASAPPAPEADAVALLTEQLAKEAEARASGFSTAVDPDKIRADAAEIIDLCAIAGKPALAAGFIRSHTAPSAVREKLLADRVSAFNAAPTSGAGGAPDAQTENGAALHAAAIAKVNAQMGFTGKGA